MSLDRTYSALSDPSRRDMLQRLSSREAMTISELAAPLAIGLPTVMKHLDVLSRAGLIERRKTGRTVAVTLVPAAMVEATRWLEQMEAFWSARIDRLVTLVEKEQP
jgi:DNA-binding transcriptional ArsR family regulator